MNPVETAKEKKRIEYFDLMKGVCIVLVIISHCCEQFEVKMGGERVWSMLEHLRMPLYFFLSGMFFKEYSGFMDFLVRKFNKLIIPMVFFIFVTLVFKLCSGEVEFALIPAKKHCTWMIKYGGYLWFLRALFFANILYYGYYKAVKHCGLKVQVSVLLALTAVGWYVNSFIPLTGDFRSTYAYLTSVITAFLVLPFFFVASNLRPMLTALSTVSLWKLVLVFLVALVTWAMSSYGGVYLVNAKVQNNILLFYLSSFAAFVCVWSVCYRLKRVFYFSYLGRYSIIAYLTHVPMLSCIVHVCPGVNIYVLASVLLVAMPPVIWLFKTLFPAFVAQRDVLLWENGRVKLVPNVFKNEK